MSLSLHLPRFAHGRHRGKTPMQLRRENDGLTCATIQLATEVDQLQAQLDAAEIELSGALKEKRAAEETAESLAEELAAAGDEMRRLRAQLANARPITVQPWQRDIDPNDIATQPIDTRDLIARFADPAGDVVWLGRSPQAAADAA